MLLYLNGYAMYTKYIKGTDWISSDCQSRLIQLVPLMCLLIGVDTLSTYLEYLLLVVYIPNRIAMEKYFGIKEKAFNCMDYRSWFEK